MSYRLKLDGYWPDTSAGDGEPVQTTLYVDLPEWWSYPHPTETVWTDVRVIETKDSRMRHEVSYYNDRLMGGACATTTGHKQDAISALRYVVNAAVDEPLFVIRGRNAIAVPVIAEYVKQSMAHGALDMADQSSEHLDRFVKWQTEHAKETHIADPYPGWINPNRNGNDGPEPDDTPEPEHCPCCLNHPDGGCKPR